MPKLVGPPGSLGLSEYPPSFNKTSETALSNSDINQPPCDYYIRLSQISDIDDILDIEIKTFKKDGFTRLRLLSLLKRGKGIFLVLYCNVLKKCIGYIYCSISKSKYARVYSIAVQFCRMGFGKKLILEAERICKYLNKLGLTLEVKESNIAAIQFYESLGYKKIDIISDYYFRGSHAIKYKKEFYKLSSSKL